MTLFFARLLDRRLFAAQKIVAMTTVSGALTLGSVPIVAQSSNSGDVSGGLSEDFSGDFSGDMEEVFVIATKQAYKGNFTPLETPQAELTIDSETLRNAGVFNLVDALDLSASVARQNNFGGLWSSFAIRGFVGDENLPSNNLVNGFNAGRGFGGARSFRYRIC